MSGLRAVRLTGWVDLPPHRRQAVLAALPDHIRRTRAEPGCRRFNVTLDPVTKQRLFVDEEFVSRAALDAHGALIRGRVWASRARGLVRHYQIQPT